MGSPPFDISGTYGRCHTPFMSGFPLGRRGIAEEEAFAAAA
jgi:hypothetical protein